MRTKVNYSDIYDVNKKTGALILGANRLDDYATKFLNKYCKEALVNPMPIPVESILSKMNLTIVEQRLSSNLDIFGCCLLLDSEVKIYNSKTKQYEDKFFKVGTILIDPVSSIMYGEGAKRNTLIHEMLHWEKDKAYFTILKLKNKRAAEKLYPIMCRQSESFYEPPSGKQTKENEVRWLEWQAHKLAPRILMPKKSFRKKAEESLRIESITCRELVKEISEFFKVSQESSKYRLFEVGLEDVLKKLDDFDSVFEDMLSKNEYEKISAVDAINMLNNSQSLARWVSKGKYIFADGYFVKADKQYVKYENGQLFLTTKAKRNLVKCVINIRVKRNVDYLEHSADPIGAKLFKVVGIDNRLYSFHPKFQTSVAEETDAAYDGFVNHILDYDEDTEIEFAKLLGDPKSSLCNCLWFLFQKRKWKYPESFNDQTLVHSAYHGRIKNNTANNMNSNTFFAICVGLKLPIRKIQKLLSKTKFNINEFEDPEKTYLRIIEEIPGLPISDFNELLEKLGMKELGSEIKAL